MPGSRSNKVSCSSYQCEIEVTLEVLTGKWKSLIIWNLHLHEKVRYNEFKKLIPGITQKMLTQQLRDLENDAIVSREVFNTAPPTVEYSLTTAGLSLIPIMEEMDKWGKEYVEFYKKHVANS